MAMPGPRLLTLIAPLALAGCAGFAPHRLYQDQLGYSRALSGSQKAETLLNIVRIRYGDSPVFLNTTQVISGYTLQQSLTGTLSLVPATPASNTLSGTPGVTFTQNPTFTFQPVTGEALAQSVIRPLSPIELLPLSLSGQPIDVLFRLAVQSVNGLQNTSMLDTTNRTGSPGFYRLLINLRKLQIAGLLGVRLDGGSTPNKDDKGKLNGTLALTLANSPDKALQEIVVATRLMLGMARDAQQAEVVYGSGPPLPGQVSLLTRPVLGVLSQVASEVQASPDDIRGGYTVPTVDDAQILTRPTVIIRSSDKPPDDTFTSVRYRDRWYWIASDDFDSKLAFSVMQMLLTLAETNPPSGTVVTIPAR